MRNRSCTRRRALQLGGAGLIAGVAGCGSIGGENGTTTGDGTGNTPEALKLVPSGAAMVAHLEVGELLDGPVVEEAVEQLIEMSAEQPGEYDGPQSYEAVLSRVETQLGLDPEGLTAATAFGMPPASSGGGVARTAEAATLTTAGSVGQQPAETATPLTAEGPSRHSAQTTRDEPVQTTMSAPRTTPDRSGPDSAMGVVLDSEWSTAAVAEAFQSEGATAPAERTYKGATVYTSDRGWLELGVLSDRRFVLGNEGGVEGVLDVDAGDADSVDGRLVSAYGNAPNGPVRMAVDFTRFPDGSGAVAETAAGGMAVESGQRRIAVDIETTDRDRASRLADVIEGELSALDSESRGSGFFPEAVQEAFARLSEFSVTQEGTTVTLEHVSSAEKPEAVGEMVMALFFYAALAIALGSSRP